MLLQQGADVEVEDKRHRTAVMYAAEGGYKDIVVLLLHHRADATHVDGEGMTALDLSSSHYDVWHVLKVRRKLGEREGGGERGGRGQWYNNVSLLVEM